MSFLDTIRTAFKGGGGGHVPLARSFTSPWYFTNDPGGTRQPYDYTRDVARAYLDNPVAQRAIRIVAESLGNAPLAAMDPQVERLVRATSAGQSLLETLTAQLLLHGNAFIHVIRDGAGVPVELFALRPERVMVEPGPDGWPVAWHYQVGERVRVLRVEDQDGWPQVIHVKGFHPADDHFGAGCLTAAAPAVAIHNAAACWNRALLENAARPSGALVFEGSADSGTLTTEQFDRLKGELASAYAGGINAGRPMLLEGGLKWQSLSLSPADMDFAELKAAAARDIALAFGVPPMLLGLPGDATYANYREANRALWRLTLLPLAAKVLAAVSEGLQPWFPGTALSIDLDKVPALAEDREKLWSQVTAADFLTPDEKRELLGLAPKPATAPQALRAPEAAPKGQ